MSTEHIEMVQTTLNSLGRLPLPEDVIARKGCYPFHGGAWRHATIAFPMYADELNPPVQELVDTISERRQEAKDKILELINSVKGDVPSRLVILEGHFLQETVSASPSGIFVPREVSLYDVDTDIPFDGIGVYLDCTFAWEPIDEPESEADEPVTVEDKPCPATTNPR